MNWIGRFRALDLYRSSIRSIRERWMSAASIWRFLVHVIALLDSTCLTMSGVMVNLDFDRTRTPSGLASTPPSRSFVSGGRGTRPFWPASLGARSALAWRSKFNAPLRQARRMAGEQTGGVIPVPTDGRDPAGAG